MGIAIRTGAKRPLKWDVRISEVQNGGVPLYLAIGNNHATKEQDVKDHKHH